MGEFLIRHVDRRSGEELGRFVAPNLLAYEDMERLYHQMFPPYQAAISFNMIISGATDEGRPNEGGGVVFDHAITFSQVAGWGPGGDDGANQGGGYTAAMATSFSSECALGQVPVFAAELRADGGQIVTPEYEFPNEHEWEPQDGVAWDDPGTLEIEQPPPKWFKHAPDDPEVKYPWHRPRKLCADIGTPPAVSSAYMKQWDASGDLDWLCDFRKIGGFPITMVAIYRAALGASKVVAAARFAAPVLLRPGTSLFITYRARIDGNVTRDFAVRFAQVAFEKQTARRYSGIFCRPALPTAPAPNRRSVYADYEPHFHAGLPEVELPAWSYQIGTPPYVTSDKHPEWLNSTGADVSFGQVVLYGVAGGQKELIWAPAIDPPAVIPAGDVLRIPGGVMFTMESI